MSQHIGFNPRAQQNSNALSDFVVNDLMMSCPQIGAAIKSETLVPKKNSEVKTTSAVRTVDLVIFEKAKLPLVSVCLSVENKTIMAAHGKARKNRYGDIIAYSNHMHNHRGDCIAGAIVVVNVSPKYENPNGFAKGLKRPKFRMEKVVRDTIGIFAGIPLRNGPTEPSDQPEAVAVIVVDYDGVSPAKLVTGPLAPQVTEPIHYECFIGRIRKLWEKRFSTNVDDGSVPFEESINPGF
jgi:hypothetical protein